MHGANVVDWVVEILLAVLIIDDSFFFACRVEDERSNMNIL